MCVSLFLFCALFPYLSSKKKLGIELEKLIQSIFIFLTASMLCSQSRIGDWESYTSPLIIHDLVEFDSKVICATEGGLLIYAGEEFSTLTNLDGLIGTKLNVIEKDLYGNIWLGGSAPDGFVQVYDPFEASSVAEFDYDLTEIIDIAVGDTIAYAVFKLNQDFGIQKFLHDGNRWNHNDLMYSDWLFESNQIAGIVVWNDSVFVATDQGLYRGDLHEDPHSWSEELTGNISSIHFIQDELFIIMDNAPYRIDLNTMEVSPIQSSVSLVEFVKTVNDSLWGIRSDRKALVHLETVLEIPVEYTLNVLIPLNNGSLAGGTDAGLTLLNPGTQDIQQLIPNAPLTNQFSAITVLNDGRIVAGSTKGLAVKEPSGWRNIIGTDKNTLIIHSGFDYKYFSADTVPIDFASLWNDEFVADIEQGPDGLVYCAIRGTQSEPRRHGGGIVIIDIDKPWNFELIDTTYLDFIATDYINVKDVEFDNIGNLWVADTYATNKFEPIQVRNAAGVWGSYIAEENGVLSLTTNTITIDMWNRVWVGSFQGEENNVGNNDYPNGGLIMLTYDGDPANPDDFQMRAVDVSPDNSNNTVWSLAITPENRLYVLTPLGLNYFDLQYSDENPVIRQGPRATNGDLYTYFPNISFGGPNPNAKVKADHKGNIWVTSTTDGIHVLLNNATYWPDIDGLRKSNSLLLSDGVTDVEFDSEKGIAWITTNRGINSLRIPFAKDKENFQSMRIFPSPFHIPSETPIVVDGLKDAASLKVMTITGRVVRDIKNIDLGIHGDQITWDGRDKQGRWVGSGVYLLSVYDETGESAFGKITVIRH